MSLMAWFDFIFLSERTAASFKGGWRGGGTGSRSDIRAAPRAEPGRRAGSGTSIPRRNSSSRPGGCWENPEFRRCCRCVLADKNTNLC